MSQPLLQKKKEAVKDFKIDFTGKKQPLQRSLPLGM